MDHQGVAIPEADGVAFPERIGLVGGDVAAVVGIDAADLGVLLGEQPGLLGAQDIFPQERLQQPARVAGGQAGRERIPLDALGDVGQLLVVHLLVRRGQGGGGLGPFLLGVEVEASGVLPKARPVRQGPPGHPGAAVRGLAHGLVLVPRGGIGLVVAPGRGIGGRRGQLRRRGGARAGQHDQGPQPSTHRRSPGRGSSADAPNRSCAAKPVVQAIDGATNQTNRPGAGRRLSTWGA